MPDYTIFDLGYDKTLNRGDAASGDAPESPVPSQGAVGVYAGGMAQSPTEQAMSPGALSSGNLSQILWSGKKTFTDTAAGFRMGVDTDGVFKWTIGTAGSYVDWSVTTAGTLTISGTLVAPTIRYGKTSFSDSAHAGYYVGTEGIYIGAASDASKLKYTIADGTFDFIGTVSSRSTLTIASAINSSGNLVTDIINARLDSSAKRILSDFNFGSTDYAGAVNAGTVTWNTATGAITGGSGVIVYRGGIIGVNSGVTTFSIDAATGAATFAGTLSAASGSLGSLTIASGGNIRSGQTAYNTGTGFWLGLDSGTAKFSIGDSTTSNSLTWDGTVLKVNGSAVTNNDTFGSGADGAFALDGTNTYATYFSKSGSTYTLLMDVYATDVTLSNSAIIDTNGYRLIANGTITVGSGCVIKRNGNNGTAGSNATNNNGAAGGSGGSALASGSVFGSVAGANGGAGGNADSVSNGVAGTAGTSGGSAANSFFLGTYSGGGVAGGAGGNGGGTGGGLPKTGGAAGGAGGAGSVSSQSTVRPYTAVYAIQMLDLVAGASVAFLRYNPGVGGSGGGGGGGGSGTGGINGGGGGGGGGSGSNGGTVVIAGRFIVNNGSVQAVGGNGGNGGNGFNGLDGAPLNPGGGGGGGGAGGRGGAGGVIVLIYSSLTGSGTVSAAGGTGGSAGTGGAAGASGGGIAAAVAGSSGGAGTTGPSGVIIQMQV